MSGMNVDLQEKAKFAALAHEWWNIYGKCKPLHDINPIRMEFILQNEPALAGKNILDVGCGGGILSEALAKQHARVTGIDIAEEALWVANQHAKQDHLEIPYHVSTAEDWATQHSNFYDLVVCMELLEHVPHPDSLINACANLVKPGGKVFFSTLNRNLKAFLYAIVGAEYILNLLPRGTHEYAKFIRPSELEKMLQDKGLHLYDISGIHYNPLTKAYYLFQDVSVNYIVACVKG